MIGGCSSRSAGSAVGAAGGGGGVGVLSSGGGGGGGGGDQWLQGVRAPEGAWTPGRPEPARNRAKGVKRAPIYRCIQGF